MQKVLNLLGMVFLMILFTMSPVIIGLVVIIILITDKLNLWRTWAGLIVWIVVGVVIYKLYQHGYLSAGVTWVQIQVSAWF